MRRYERLQQVIQMKSDNEAQFERMMGWESGELSLLSQSMNNDRLIEVLSKFCDISARWLLFGEGFYFGTAKDGIIQKLTMLANVERYVPVMNDSERALYEDAISVKDFTLYASEHLNEWENRLEKASKS